jgi:hypothetical protein
MSWFAKAATTIRAVAASASNELQQNFASGPAPPDASSLTLFVADAARRQSHFDLLRAMVEGEAPVFNAVVVSGEEDLHSICGQDDAGRVQLWYSVALSIGRILSSTQQSSSPDSPPVDILLRCLCQLFYEVDHASGEVVLPDALLHLGGLAASAVASTSSGSGGGGGSSGGSSLSNDFYPESVRKRPDEPIKPTLHTAKGSVVYECLMRPGTALPCPFPLGSLDYREVAISLLEALSTVYGRLRTAKGLDYPAIPPNLSDAFSKLDKRIMKQVVRPLCEDLAKAATVVLQRRLRTNDGTGYVPRGGSSLSDETTTTSVGPNPLFLELSAKSARLLREATQLASSSSSPPAVTAGIQQPQVVAPPSSSGGGALASTEEHDDDDNSKEEHSAHRTPSLGLAFSV